jgi:hypothetical protein
MERMAVVVPLLTPELKFHGSATQRVRGGFAGDQPFSGLSLMCINIAAHNSRD